MKRTIAGEENSSGMIRLVIFAPSRKRASETFIRANMAGLPFRTSVYCGDEVTCRGSIWRTVYGISIAFSKVATRLGLLHLATWFPSIVATEICRHEKPDVVLAEFGFHAVRIMELVPKTGLPLIVHFRGADASAQRYIGRLSGRYERLLGLCSGIIVKSRQMSDRLLALAKPGSKVPHIIVSPSGANDALFRGSHPASAPPTFLAVGRFVEKKGPLITIEAFANATRSRPDLKLVMVGDGPLLKKSRALAKHLGVAEKVVFAGVESSAVIAQRMKECRAFVQHSVTAVDGDEEGVPVAIMEAQLSGLPVIATFHAGIPDVVLQGRTGILVQEGDQEGMATAIGLLADSTRIAGEMGSAACIRASSRFRIENHLADLTEMIHHVVLEHRSSDKQR